MNMFEMEEDIFFFIHFINKKNIKQNLKIIDKNVNLIKVLTQKYAY